MTTPPRTSDEIRESFLSFFREREHRILPGWPLVPIGDPTSLFTSAGMQQFKPVFTGEQESVAPRVTTVQPCFRTTDIEEVGDFSHCTAFEMLGNFSFGDYFKKEAIAWAWELLTVVYQIPADLLHITIYLDDEEAYEGWRAQGVPDTHIHRCDEDKNYWFSFPNGTPGASGPCGPCSEIYYDFHPERGLEDIQVAYDDERFLEIWNLVFMQLMQNPDGTRVPLPTQNIDTGSGLERVAAVQQGKRSVFETDIFIPILEEASTVAGFDYFEQPIDSDVSYSIRAMAEHCRAATMLIGDGVVPSNEGRGYVLRRVIRRAIYFARKIGVSEPFTARLAEAAIGKLKTGYPHLEENQAFIQRALNAEEERFLRTISAGSHRLDQLLERLRGEGADIVPGEEAFTLYDTFGLPLELTREIAAAAGFDVDEAGFEASMDAQRARARQQGKFLLGESSAALQAIGEGHSDFVGYTHAEADAHIAAILSGGNLVDLAVPGSEFDIVLDTTPFYPEGGGQVGDRGTIRTGNAILQVLDTQAQGGAIVHHARVVEGEVRPGDTATAIVDLAYRAGSTRNHTATHMLHAALREILGSHVRQQGSLVTPDRLRFDFTHLEQTPRSALLEAQHLVNEKIRTDLGVTWRTTSYQQAIAGGALAFFGDKYGADVRVVEIRDGGQLFSAELCGGTHVHSTGQLGFVLVLRESAVAAGTRRIEALSGAAAESYLVEQQERVLRIADRLSTSSAEIEERLDALQTELERLRKQEEQLRRAQGAGAADSLLSDAVKIGAASLVVARVDGASADTLKEMADTLRQKLGSALVILAGVDGEKVALLVAASQDLVGKGVHSGNLVREIAKVAGGGGGGRPDLAQAGAKDPSKVGEALEFARTAATEVLTGAS